MLEVTATNLPRFLACSGSHSMEKIPPANPDDTLKDEGNAADWVVGEIAAGRFSPEELIDRKTPNGVYITADMIDYLEEYFQIVSLDNAQVELDCSWSGQGFRVNGRADCVLYDSQKETLKIYDLKYGWRIIEPDGNFTLVSHAISKLEEYDFEYVHLTIYQPRPYHPEGKWRTKVYTRQEIINLASMIAHILQNPSNTLSTGTHCYKCPSRAICPAALQDAYLSVDIADAPYHNNMNDDELEVVYEELQHAKETLENTITAYKDLMINKLKMGAIMNNHHVDHGYGNRAWKKEITPEFLEMFTGKDYTEKKLLSPNKAVKAGLDKDVMESFVERPYTGIKLVRMDANKRAKKLLDTK